VASTPKEKAATRLRGGLAAEPVVRFSDYIIAYGGFWAAQPPDKQGARPHWGVGGPNGGAVWRRGKNTILHVFFQIF